MSSSPLSPKLAFHSAARHKAGTAVVILLLWGTCMRNWDSLVAASKNLAGTATDTVKQLRGQQPSKASPECCQRPSSDIFSPCEWACVGCWCPKWDDSVLRSAGEKPGKFLKLQGYTTEIGVALVGITSLVFHYPFWSHRVSTTARELAVSIKGGSLNAEFFILASDTKVSQLWIKY